MSAGAVWRWPTCTAHIVEYSSLPWKTKRTKAELPWKDGEHLDSKSPIFVLLPSKVTPEHMISYRGREKEAHEYDWSYCKRDKLDIIVRNVQEIKPGNDPGRKREKEKLSVTAPLSCV